MYKYEHGGDIYSQTESKRGNQFIDFSANINPLGLPSGVKKAIKQALNKCIHYPDPFCRCLREATANFLNLPNEYFFFGNGADDVLFRLSLALKPQTALLLAPTFADYEKSLKTVNCNIKYYNLQEKNAFEPQQDILEKIDRDISLVVICNPNNPTGQLIKKSLLEQILEKCHSVGAFLLIDECFMDLVSEKKAYTLMNMLKYYPKLIILKAFTKTYAMPGIRLGYCLNSNKELHMQLYENGQDWSVSVLAQEAGIAALQENKYLQNSLRLINTERTYLIKQLTTIGAKVYGSEANYIFFFLDSPQNLEKKLRMQGYLIRSCANYHNLRQGYYRVAVKTRVLNRGLIKAIKEAKQYALFAGFN